MKKDPKYYEPKEEKLNVFTHAIGLALSIIAFFLLINYASDRGSVWHVSSFAIFGASLIVLYSASTAYHYVKNPALRTKLNILDHAAIYVLIAGTYTPFCLTVLPKGIGWTMFIISWTIALIGIVFKLFYTGKYDRISTIAYVLMGWIVIFAIKPLIENLPLKGVLWLFAGGLFYTIGAILYSMKAIRYNHAIFHVFVLLGSFCHFMSIFFYVLPEQN
ncbi:MAG: hemolysin III family protein [Lutimonas sp.]